MSVKGKQVSAALLSVLRLITFEFLLLKRSLSQDSITLAKVIRDSFQAFTFMLGESFLQR